MPAGRGHTSFVDARDVVAADMEGLEAVGRRNTACALTGDQALGDIEVAKGFSEILGRGIRYANPWVLAFIRRMREQEHPWPFVLVMADLYPTARFGLAATVTDDLKQAMGRPTTSMHVFVRDDRSC